VLVQVGKYFKKLPSHPGIPIVLAITALCGAIGFPDALWEGVALGSIFWLPVLLSNLERKDVD